ncbi:Hypothetical protein FKW44_025274 [Caligus rogercresseyi]|uniref:Uncharacterized protein n=1 Tax=Caligus rogercresseyi TaxID=217165 RepID=A0A7T8JT19_CALRO|nr:Hypothetical protein FKW44_025274 [Caligus rogercresseyi]
MIHIIHLINAQLSAHRSVAVLYSGGGGGPPALILKQSTISTVANGHAMKIPHKRPCMDLGRDSHPPHTLEGGPNTTTPSPALASLFMSL